MSYMGGGTVRGGGNVRGKVSRGEMSYTRQATAVNAQVSASARQNVNAHVPH